MDYQEVIELLKGEIKCSCYRNRGYCGICTIYSELERDKIIDACKCAISAIQELQEQREIINQNKDYSEVQKWMQNIIDDAMVCLDEMKQDAKKNLNTHYSPLLYEGRKRKAKTVIYALIELNAYKQLRTLKEVRDAVEKQKKKKPIEDSHHEIRHTEVYRCPSCNGIFSGRGFAKYCFHCGQAIDWGKEEFQAPYHPNKCHACFGAANNDCERCMDGNEK